MIINPMPNPQLPPHPLKAVILAVGSKSITEDGLPVLLQDLGGRKIID